MAQDRRVGEDTGGSGRKGDHSDTRVSWSRERGQWRRVLTSFRILAKAGVVKAEGHDISMFINTEVTTVI